jgi:2-polyprenyl-3-methyl-5-hydroxy-6-metoxy-1,4-benzoquinol methylase
MTAEIEEALVERGRLRHIRENVALDGAHGFFGASVVPVGAGAGGLSLAMAKQLR